MKDTIILGIESSCDDTSAAVIRNGINKILEHGSFRDNEEVELKELIDLRHALLDPEWGKLQFMSRNFH